MLRFAGTKDWLYMPHRNDSLQFFDRPSSSNLPDFKPLLYWQQPLSSLFCENRPEHGDDYLTEINFADPLKPYPVLHHELAAAISSNHPLIQHLISSNPSDPDQRMNIVGYAHSFSKYKRQLVDLARELAVKIPRGGSLYEVEQDILNWDIMMSTDQNRRVLDVLDGITCVELAIKKELGYGVEAPPKGEPLSMDFLDYGLHDSLKSDQPLGTDMLAYGMDKSLKCDQHLALCARRRMLLARMSKTDIESLEMESCEPLEPLFGLNTEDSFASHMDIESLERLLDIEDDGSVSFTGNRPVELNNRVGYKSYLELG
jgi:hypothetical protein